jgi:hypothetical protein
MKNFLPGKSQYRFDRSLLYFSSFFLQKNKNRNKKKQTSDKNVFLVIETMKQNLFYGFELNCFVKVLFMLKIRHFC